MVRSRTRTVLTALFLTGVLVGGVPAAASAVTPASVAAVSRTASSVQGAGHVSAAASVHTGVREAAHTYWSKSKSKSKKRRKHGSGGFGGGVIVGIVLAVIVVGIIAFVLVSRSRRNS
ncbi:hypothetical protein [Streptomyces sp. NBC_01013]|uniref:hypothetical protein n=1 Tax=Streptomyces sp. NBC_01013 TaxID=2903718 RepID=UPI003870CC2D|nr:hypothetical protein OG538_21125 [Streptomyces sp. NBC_01013]